MPNTLPDFELADFTEEIRKRKLSQADMYLLALRQILKNQAVILGGKSDVTSVEHYRATESLIARLEEFAVHKE